MTGKGETTLRIKELFSIPEGKKVTEKVFGRVLLSSICSILLCMVCLAGTTWAWFTVSIENRGNEIQIATVEANVSMQDAASNVAATDTNGKYTLVAGTYTAQINLSNDATEPKSPVYVVISVSHSEETAYYYLTFENGGKDATQSFQVGENSATVNFSVSWVKPVSANTVGGEAIVIGGVLNEPVSEHSTETTALVSNPSTETTSVTTESSADAALHLPTEPSTEAASPSAGPSTGATNTAVSEPEGNPYESNPTETTNAGSPAEETISTKSTEFLGDTEPVE